MMSAVSAVSFAGPEALGTFGRRVAMTLLKRAACLWLQLSGLDETTEQNS
jgi:hypothetical protein